MSIERAKNILSQNTMVLYGIFGIVDASDYFPTKNLLNQFFELGYDPCDQDGQMGTWDPFELTEKEFEIIVAWWLQDHPNARIDSLGAKVWSEWSYEIIEMG